MVAAMKQNEFVILNQKDIDERAVGVVAFWRLSGDVDRARLVQALPESTGIEAPDEVSAKVALHRAVEQVARSIKGEALMRKRGDWVVTAKGVDTTIDTDGDGQADKAALAFQIRTSARVDKIDEVWVLTAEGEHADVVRVAYVEALRVLAAADIGGWLCDVIQRMGGVALRDGGGFYFLPADRVDRWRQVVGALHSVSGHQVMGLPAMRSQDAVDAILQAITADTRAACDKIHEEIPTAGKRALEAREETTRGLLDRVERYEGLLGARLDELRQAIDDTRNAVATAVLLAGASGEGS